MENILNFTRDELSEWFEEAGVKPFRASQVFKWLYIRQADIFEQMTDLSKDLRRKLADHFYIQRLIMDDRQVSADTTEKFLFRLEDGQHIESVLIPEKDHFTLCVSSQVGCAQGCRFCMTAQGGFIRNLNVCEIIAQIRDARYYLVRKDIDPLKLLLEACRTFIMKPRNKITFEYILMKGVNDSKEDALNLVKFLSPIKAKVNLIAYNQGRESSFQSPSRKVISSFLQILLDNNLTAMTRRSKGDDILAACGQLKAKL